MDAFAALAAHLGQLVVWAVVVGGPIPLAVRALVAVDADLRDAPLGHAHLTVLLLWTLAQTALGLLLGWLHLLELAALLTGELILAGVGLWALRRAGARRVRDLATRLWPERALSAPMASLVFAVGVVGLVLAWETITTCTRNFDSLAYHLPLIARWVREGTFARFVELGQTARYPLDWELLSALFFLPLRDDVFVALPNLLAWVELGLAAYLVGRRLGARPEASATAATFLLTLPTLLDRIAAIQPDIAMTAFFLSALYFGLRLETDTRASDAVLLLASLTLLVGAKMSGPSYALLVVVTLVLARALRARRGSPVSARWRPPASGALVPGKVAWGAWLALLAFVGGFWYARNLVQLGNPLGLLEVEVAGHTILRGSLQPSYLRQTTIAAIFDFGRREHWRLLLDVARRWLGLPFACLLFVTLAGAAVAAARRRVRAEHAVILLVLGLATLVAYWNTPYSGDNGSHDWKLTPWIYVGLRYAFPMLAVLSLAAALGLESLPFPVVWMLPLPVLACIVGVLVTLSPGQWVLRMAVLLALLPSLALAARGRPKVPPGLLRPAVLLGAAALVAVAGALTGWSEREADRAAAFGAVYTWMEKNVGARETIGVVNAQKIYPLWGRRWTRRVLPVAPARDDLTGWTSRLRRDGVRILVVGQAPPPDSRRESTRWVQGWLHRADAPFELLRDYDSMRFDLAVYRLRGR
jgi:hypothetical protein